VIQNNLRVFERVMTEGLQAESLKIAVAKTNAMNLDVVVHPSIDSTNNWCLSQYKAGRNLPFACFAEEQTAGKGRRGKRWVGEAYSNLAMSVIWPFALREQPLQLLSLSIAIAIAQTLEDFGLQQVQIKWPNDVYVQGEKISGVLIETQPIRNNTMKNTEIAVVIGIGLNYDMSKYDGSELEAGRLLTDICEQFIDQQSSPLPKREDVASKLLINIVAVCQNFQQFVDTHFELFSSRYDFCKGKNVEIILDDNVSLSGVAQGINESAALIVLIEGELQVFNSAEVSVKAMNEEK